MNTLEQVENFHFIVTSDGQCVSLVKLLCYEVQQF